MTVGEAEEVRIDLGGMSRFTPAYVTHKVLKQILPSVTSGSG